MTTPPLPESPCVRVRLDYTQGDTFLAGSRFYLAFGGSAPTPGNCQTLAADVGTAWSSHLGPLIDSNYTLSEVDVLDISSLTGSSGQNAPASEGSRSGTPLTAAAATNVEFGIARRYRGGKPRMFLPPGVLSDISTAATWSETFTGEVNTGMGAFFTEIEGLDIGAMGTLQHVNLSYYAGFTNVTNSSGRTRAAPKYRAAAVVDTVESYICKALIGSQRRRRNATTY